MENEGCDLKNYDKYLQSLELYITAVGFRLEYKTEPCDGVYMPSKSLIRVDPDLSESDQIAIILHELGHLMDDSTTKNNTLNRAARAYEAVYKDEATKGQKRLVRSCEIKAWRYGEAIAKNLDIKLGKWYRIAKKKCLDCYKVT